MDLFDTVLAGKPIEIMFIDSHMHAGYYAEMLFPETDYDNYTDRYIHYMDKTGCDIGCVSGLLTDDSASYTYGNDMVGKLIKECPERIFGYTVVSPVFQEEIVPELERCYYGLNMRGVKLHHYYARYPVQGPAFEEVYKWVNDKKLILKRHSWGDAKYLERVANQYPDGCYIIGHGSSLYKDLINKYDNIYLSITSLCTFGGLKELLEEVDEDKVLYGSDYNYNGIGGQIGTVAFADIKESVKKKILGGNMKRALSKYSTGGNYEFY